MIHVAQINHQDPNVARQLHAILKLAYAQEAAVMQTVRFSELDETIEEIHGSHEFFLGAIEENVLLGSLSIGPDDEPNQINISTFVVHPTHQRRGVGRMLLKDVMRRSEGMVISVCTGANNIPALALYMEFGFVEYRHGTIGPENHALVKLKTGAP